MPSIDIRDDFQHQGRALERLIALARLGNPFARRQPTPSPPPGPRGAPEWREPVMSTLAGSGTTQIRVASLPGGGRSVTSSPNESQTQASGTLARNADGTLPQLASIDSVNEARLRRGLPPLSHQEYATSILTAPDFATFTEQERSRMAQQATTPERRPSAFTRLARAAVSSFDAQRERAASLAQVNETRQRRGLAPLTPEEYRASILTSPDFSHLKPEERARIAEFAASDTRPAAADRDRERHYADPLRQQGGTPPPEKRMVRDGRPRTPAEAFAQGGFDYPIGEGVAMRPFEMIQQPRPLRSSSGAGVELHAGQALDHAVADRGVPVKTSTAATLRSEPRSAVMPAIPQPVTSTSPASALTRGFTEASLGLRKVIEGKQLSTRSTVNVERPIAAPAQQGTFRSPPHEVPRAISASIRTDAPPGQRQFFAQAASTRVEDVRAFVHDKNRAPPPPAPPARTGPSSPLLAPRARPTPTRQSGGT